MYIPCDIQIPFSNDYNGIIFFAIKLDKYDTQH